MITKLIFRPLRLIPLLCLFGFLPNKTAHSWSYLSITHVHSSSHISIQQQASADDFEVSDFKASSSAGTNPQIKFLLPDGEGYEYETLVVGRKFPFGTLIAAQEGIEITLRTPNGYTVVIDPNSKLIVNKDEFAEDTRLVNGKAKVSKDAGKKKGWLQSLKEKASAVLDFFGGSKDEVQAAVRGTTFTLENKGDSLNIQLNEGVLDINKRQKFRINEKFIQLDSIPDRQLFVTETVEVLNAENLNYASNLNVQSERRLESEKQIDSFFKSQYRKQKDILTSGGPNSRIGFHQMERGLDSLGLESYNLAMQNGEINRDRFIQAALIITEAYFRESRLKERDVWLYAAIDFIQEEHEVNERKYLHFKNAGEDAASLGYGDDLAVTQEYFAWAYTVKLKITGCLESGNQNPLTWIRKAEKLKSSLNEMRLKN